MTRTIVAGAMALVASARITSAQDAIPAPGQHEPIVHVEAAPHEGPPLTLKAAIEEALARNPRLVALRRQFEAVRHRPAQERYLMPPTFEAEIWQWPLDTINPLNVNMYMFNVRQDIPGAGKRALRASAAEKEVDRASNDIVVEARDVIAQVKRAYADLFVNRQAIDIHQRSVDLLRQIADLSTVKYTAGRGGQQDVLKTVVEISKLHGDLIMFDERAQLASAELNVLLNRRADAPIGELTQPPEGRLPALDDLQSRALTSHPQLRAAALDVEQAQAAVALAYSEYKPDFMVGGGYQLMPRTVGAWTAVVGITWPRSPWSHGALDAKKAEAIANVDAARAREQAVESQVRLAVQQAYVRATSAAARASLLRTSVLPQSQHTIEVSRIAYQTDRGDALALVDNQRMLLDAQLEYFRALSEVEQARADLEHAIGEDLFPASAESNTAPPTVQIPEGVR